MGCVSKTDYLPRDVGWVHVLPSVSVSLHRTETGFWWEEAITRALAPALLGQGCCGHRQGRGSSGGSASVSGRQTPHHLHLLAHESQEQLALRRQQNWEQRFSNFSI